MAANSSTPLPATCLACSPTSTRTFPRSPPRSRTKTANCARFINIYVNDEDIRFLGGDAYAFQDGDEVMLIPSIAGGSKASAIEADKRLAADRASDPQRYLHVPEDNQQAIPARSDSPG